MAERLSFAQLPPMSRRRAASRFDDKRSPLVRLESLIKEPGKDRSRRIIGRIREELDRTPEPGPWIAAARALEAKGAISTDAVYYFVEIFLECITAQAAWNDPELLRLYGEMNRVKREHGLGEDEDWLVHEAPAAWQTLNAAWDRRDEEIRVATLRALGHHDIADVMESHPDDFSRREASGYYDLWGAGDDE